MIPEHRRSTVLQLLATTSGEPLVDKFVVWWRTSDTWSHYRAKYKKRIKVVGKIVNDLLASWDVRHLTFEVIGGQAQSRYFPQIRHRTLEEELRARERSVADISRTPLRYLYKLSKKVTATLRQSLSKIKTGPKVVFIFGLDGFTTSWDRLVKFCRIEQPFWLIVHHPVRKRSPYGPEGDENVHRILPLGPYAGSRYGRSYSKDLLATTLPPSA